MRSKSMQALTDDIRKAYPGVVIYGIGDEPHKLRSSDHNEDDTPGSKAAQSDSDHNPEHRAIDIMLGLAFSKEQAYDLINRLLADPAARARLYYIIFDGWIWSRSNGWKKTAFDGDPHRDHPHISGLAADDENGAGWPAVSKGGVTPVWCKRNDQNENVLRVQLRLRNLGYDIGTADRHYGPKTQAALAKACKDVYSGYRGDGSSYEADEDLYLDVLMARKYGGGQKGDKGDPGAPGKDGKDGKDAELILPETITIEAQIRQPQA